MAVYRPAAAIIDEVIHKLVIAAGWLALCLRLLKQKRRWRERLKQTTYGAWFLSATVPFADRFMGTQHRGSFQVNCQVQFGDAMERCVKHWWLLNRGRSTQAMWGRPYSESGWRGWRLNFINSG